MGQGTLEVRSFQTDALASWICDWPFDAWITEFQVKSHKKNNNISKSEEGGTTKSES